MCVQKDDETLDEKLGRALHEGRRQQLTPFDPKHPHGHVTRDGRKATVHRVLNDGCIIASLDDGSTGGDWYPNGHSSLSGVNPLDLLNASAPKRTWEVVAVEWQNSGPTEHDRTVTFHSASWNPGRHGKIIGRYTLTEGQGMEEKDV